MLTLGCVSTALAPPPAALDLYEAAAARPSALSPDGTCLIHIIRPGRGLGRGSHFYPARMLQENAHVFTGWNVYVDHESEEAKRARGSLPRSLNDVGGLIEESWWDPSVPAEGRFGQGAVVGRLRPIRDLREIIAELPQAARFSIKARATDVSEGVEEGHQVWVVEGIRDNPPGSVDAVTLDGAGGKVAALLEAMPDDEHSLREAEETLEEAKLTAQAAKKLPESAFAIPESREYPIHDESHARAALSLVEAQGSEEQQKQVRDAVKARYPDIDVQEATSESPDEGEGDTVKELMEALRDPESEVAQAVKEMAKTEAAEIVEAAKEEIEGKREEVREEVREELQSDFDERVKTQVEEARAEERAGIEREKSLRSLRETAHGLIDGAELGSAKLTAKLKGQFDLSEAGEPTEALDLVDRVDGDGNVVKSAEEQLREAVEAEIADAREVLAEAKPTEVSGQGGGEGGENGDQEVVEGAEQKPTKTGEKRYYRELLEESGVDPDEAYPDRKVLVESGTGKE